MTLTAVLAHNRYRLRGGEDVAFEADAGLLEAAGHRVIRFERSSDDISSGISAAAGALWSDGSARQLAELIERYHPDIVHVHNPWPLLSPSVYAAARRRGVPVVQTVANYRLVCAAATLLRDGRPCHDCVGRTVPLPAVRYGCYHDSRVHSAVPATAQLLRPLTPRADRYLAVSDHVRRVLIDGGTVSNDRIEVRPNFCTAGPPALGGADAVFVGRLVAEKGPEVLIRAAARVPGRSIVIAGDGPQRTRLIALAAELGARNVRFVGALDRIGVEALLRTACFLVVPSLWEEPFGLVLIEAAAMGVAAVASNIGAIPEIVTAASGVLVPPGDVAALAAALGIADGWRERGAAARARWEAEYSPEVALPRLLDAYRRVTPGAAW